MIHKEHKEARVGHREYRLRREEVWGSQFSAFLAFFADDSISDKGEQVGGGNGDMIARLEDWGR